MSLSQVDSAKASILVVGDTPANLRLLTEILTQKGYLVQAVLDGSLAIVSAKTEPPDLILLDTMMPGISGYDVCKELKTDERTRDIPIIFISALNEVFDKIRAFSIGGVDYITKPFQTEEVLARVEIHLSLWNLRKKLQEQNFQLQQEITERKRVEEALKWYNRELDLLNQMNLSLQTCFSQPKTYKILRNTCRKMFPSASGCIYMMNNAQMALDVVVFWGNPPPEARVVTVNHFGEMSSGMVYVIEHSKNPPLYLHLRSSQDDSGYLCALRDTSGKIMGILHLNFEQELDTYDDEEYQQYTVELKQILATKTAEQYALFLVTLRLREALKREATRDPLTGLFNRRYMEEALAREAYRAKRYNTTVGIIMLDVDRFKSFNDTYGHETGDIVLQKLGSLLQRNIRSCDIACRYGGEEFLLILPDATLEATEKRAKELMSRLRKLAIMHQDLALHITVSIGVAALPNHGTDVRKVVSTADTALYQAKKNGRNQIIIASS